LQNRGRKRRTVLSGTKPDTGPYSQRRRRLVIRIIGGGTALPKAGCLEDCRTELTLNPQMMSHVKVAEINERVVSMASCRSTQSQRTIPSRASRDAAVIAMAGSAWAQDLGGGLRAATKG
jgi:hypothetical protein